METNKNLFIDIHCLQTVPPSCINRDDTNAPKTCTYGGALRARVSSQSWKRAVRMYFAENLDKDKVGMRTKLIVELIAEKIMELDPEMSEEKAMKMAKAAAGKVMKLKKAKDESGEEADIPDVLFFISHPQAKALAELALAGETDGNAYKRAAAENPAIDMALFGRMVASDPSLNYDATVQVAHAISTHAVENGYDYFTAVDDCKKSDSSGAGHIGSNEFNSSTLYRYATINVGETIRLLGEEDGQTAIKTFIQGFVMSMPSGKQNGFANGTIPGGVYVTVRTDQPINLAGAFETPIVSDNGYLKASEQALQTFSKQLYQDFVNAPEKEYSVGYEQGTRCNFAELLKNVSDDVSNYLN